MKEAAEYFTSYIWLFGALAFWPGLKYLVKVNPNKLTPLKWLFWLQVFWLVVTFGLVQYYKISGYQDWMHGLILPYVVGAISWVSVIVALLATGIRSKLQNREGSKGGI